jgi:hypothetical protein
VDGKTYQFNHIIAGNAGREILGTSADLGDITVNGEIFHKSSWSDNSTPFRLLALTENYNKYGDYELQIPPNNQQYYINLFNQIVNSFRVIK